MRLTKSAYGWDPDAKFLVPQEALEHFRAATARGAELEAAWDTRAARLRERDPQKAALLELLARGELPAGWDAQLPRFDASAKPIATRKASGEVIQWAARAVPTLLGGSADLASSTLTDIEDAAAVRAGDYSGRNINFGVREHAMGAIVNGLVLHGFRALGATFLTFSDYMRGAVRLSALMKLPSIWVYTHDSIGLGEDGPTHQPIEQLAALRAIPRLRVLRPADANETALAWRFALRHQDGPSAFALSRQNLPIIDPARSPTTRSNAAPTCCADAGGAGGERRSSSRPARRSRSRSTPRRRSRARGSRRASSRCRAWTTSPRASRPTATRCCRRRSACASPSRPRARSAGTAGSGRGALRRDAHVRRVWPGRAGLRAFQDHRPPRRRARSRAARRARGLNAMATQSHTVNANLAALAAAGTAPWLDQIRRELIESGELARLRDEYSLRGVTSNPAIFEQAILGSDDYDEELRELAGEDLDDMALFERIAIADVRDAADVLRPVHDEHGDGFVSFEVAPTLAHDTGLTIEKARSYWQRLDRPNVMIKIPGTDAGVPAIEQAIYEGINVNVTLLFGIEQYGTVAEAYIRGLERRHAEGLPLAVIRSRASSSRASTPRSTSVWSPSDAASSPARRRSPTRAPPTRASARSSRASASPRCAPPARSCSAPCGPPPASRTRPTATRSTSSSLSLPTPSTRCR